MKKGLLISVGVIILIFLIFRAIEMYHFTKGLHSYAQRYDKALKPDPNKEKQTLKNGRWISTEDSLSSIEIKDNQWFMLYEGQLSDSTDIYNIQLHKATIGTTASVQFGLDYLTLHNRSDTLRYSITAYTNDFLSLIYLARGNTLNYRPEK